MDRHLLVLAGVTIVASILVFGLFATGTSWSPATADHAEIITIDTTPLEGLSLEPDEFLLLADTTPAEIESGHVALSIPCTDGDSPESDIDVVAGVAPDVSSVELEYVGDLSDPDNNRCTFHVDLPEDEEDITDVAIINSGEEIVEFESGHFATISLTTAKADHDDDKEDDEDVDDEEDTDAEDEENETGEERTFTASLTGDNEVPEVDTNATGDAELTFEEGDDEIQYTVNVQDITDVISAHIHEGQEGENGDIVVTLYEEAASGDIDGELASGEIVASDLEGPLADQELDDLITMIEDGEAYVNVHTTENPDGEIRGQLEE